MNLVPLPFSCQVVYLILNFSCAFSPCHLKQMLINSSVGPVLPWVVLNLEYNNYYHYLPCHYQHVTWSSLRRFRVSCKIIFARCCCHDATRQKMLFWTGRSCYEEWGNINFFFFFISGMCFKWGVTCWDSFECIYCTCIAWPQIQSFIHNRRTSSPAVHCSPVSTPAIILYRTVNLSSPPTPPPSLIMIPIIPLDSGLNPLQHLRLKCGLARSFGRSLVGS